MQRFTAILLLTLSSCGFAQQHVDVITINGTINPASSKYISQSIENSGAGGAECLVMRLDTPGGLVTSMREISKSILGAPLPVIVYVAPSGARAGSAGVFITIAAHVAAMSPGTNIGAASVVSMNSGQDSTSQTMMKKATNDAIAFIRSLAEERGRNAEWAEEAVRDAVSVTANEALKLNVIDYIAPTLDSLLLMCDGRIVTVHERADTLQTAGARIEEYEMSLSFRILDKISDPSIAYFLLMIAIWGLMFELYNPGGIIPGIIGAIAFILFLYGASSLPVNYAGVLLILLAVILFLLEIKIPSYGALTLGGITAFVLGSVMLYDSDFALFQISWELIAVVTLSTAGFFVLAIGLGLNAQRRRPAMGREKIIEGVATALESFQEGRGQVRYEGAIWQAVSEDEIAEGDKVRITVKNGLRLSVKKI